MPIDAKLVPLRTLPERAVPYVLRYGDHPGHVSIHTVPSLEKHRDHGDPECGVFVSHFVTCPNASSHSKRGKSATSIALCIALLIVTLGLPACKSSCGNVGPGANGVELRRC